MPTDLVVASNRGPVSFARNEAGGLESTHGAGGLASSLAPLVRDTGATWVAAAITDADREAAAAGLVETEGFSHRYVPIADDVYAAAYDQVSNATLWFLHHGLWDLGREPTFDRTWRTAWDAYREVNRGFAEAIMSEAAPGATVLVQDYHLYLAGTWLAKERPDLQTAHFTHTPFCTPAELAVLPIDVATELLEGMAAFRACGFHTTRWATAFADCADAVLGRSPATFVSPLSPDPASLTSVAASPDGAAASEWVEGAVDGRKMILRVDRLEPSKNLLRGFLAYEELLRSRPGLRGEVVFVALVYPSRQNLPIYLSYFEEVEALVTRINADWSTTGWTPIVLDTHDDYPRSIAALQRYDVLLVNPVRDGLNLVAKEGPIVNRTDGVLVLSPEAGAWDEMGSAALTAPPYDVMATADQLGAALSMDAPARHAHASALRAAATRRRPKDWLDDQFRAARAR
jgi:trehalose 6-phosphate synthase